MENDAVEQELVINSTNPMVDGNGQEAVAASAAVISESTSVGLDYIANSLNIQHHETCPSVAVSDVLDDGEENIIEPDVCLSAAMMSDEDDDEEDGGGGDDAGCDVDGICESTSAANPLVASISDVVDDEEMSNDEQMPLFTNGGSTISPTPMAIATTPRNTKHLHGRRSTSSQSQHSRSRRALRRCGGIHKEPANNSSGSGTSNSASNGLKTTVAAAAVSASAAGVAYDEFMAFGVTVAAKLSKMSTYQRLYAENIINQTLFKGMLNQLRSPESDGGRFVYGVQQQQHYPQQQQQQQEVKMPSISFALNSPTDNTAQPNAVIKRESTS